MTAGSDTANSTREEEAFAPRPLTEIIQQPSLPAQIGREATPVWLHSCYRRIEKQVTKVCFSITHHKKIQLVARKFVAWFSKERTM